MIDILWQAFADAHIKGAQGVHDDHAKLIDWRAEAAPIAAECRNQVIQELTEAAKADFLDAQKRREEMSGTSLSLRVDRAKATYEWLKSQMEGE